MTNTQADESIWNAIEDERQDVEAARRKVRQRKRLNLRRVILLVVFMYILGAFIPLGVILINSGVSLRPVTDWGTLAQVGDMFGAANALVSTAALLAAIYAVMLQTRELENVFVENWAQALELRIAAVSHKETARSHRAALSAEVILPLIKDIKSASEARRFVAFFLRKHLQAQLGTTSLEEYRARFQRREVDHQDSTWRAAVKSARAEFRKLRDGEIETVKVETFERPLNYKETQDYISNCVETAHKIHGLWKARVIESDEKSAELAKIVLTPDVVATLEFQYRPLAEEQRSERSGDTDLPPVDFAVALYSSGGLDQFAANGQFSEIADEVFRNSRV